MLTEEESGQSVSRERASPPLRGELIRFPDGTVNLSVFARTPDVVPSSLWERVSEVREIAFLGSGSRTGDATTLLERLDALCRGPEALRIVRDPSELQPFGVQLLRGTWIRFAWYDLDEAEALQILADSRAADPSFKLKVLIPDLGTGQGWRSLRPKLDRAGIRRVQILSGDP